MLPNSWGLFVFFFGGVAVLAGGTIGTIVTAAGSLLVTPSARSFGSNIVLGIAGWIAGFFLALAIGAGYNAFVGASAGALVASISHEILRWRKRLRPPS